MSAHEVLVDVTIRQLTSDISALDPLEMPGWKCLEKDLHLHSSEQTAWMFAKYKAEADLSSGELVIEHIAVSDQAPNDDPDCLWEGRPYGLWVKKGLYNLNEKERFISEIDILFGIDAVEPRPGFNLMDAPLRLDAPKGTPIARLTVRHGERMLKIEPPILRVGQNGEFKILLIADTHMNTGVGVCKDNIDAEGNYLAESEADPLTLRFMADLIDLEKPDLVILTGDQLHHDIPDSQSALFKVVSPMIQRAVPWAAIFGNHDSEGEYALSRMEQMTLLQNLPYSLCEPGPEAIHGVGNFVLHVLPFSANSHQTPPFSLYFLDSHGEIPGDVKPDYDPIHQSQKDWISQLSENLRESRTTSAGRETPHVALAFQHIPIPEFGLPELRICEGQRREPTEGPKHNSGFYETLVRANIFALFCGHDHVNDFCAYLPQQPQPSSGDSLIGPWLCHIGCTGFGAYCSYAKERFRRAARVISLNSKTGKLATWQRVQHLQGMVNEIDLTSRKAEIYRIGSAQP